MTTDLKAAVVNPQDMTPSLLGFRMPAEWEPHERCIRGWSTLQRIPALWEEHYLLAMA